MKKKWYHYKDFITGKARKTCGQFIGWTKCGLGIRRAIFYLKSGEWFIPEYCLIPETRKELERITNNG